jgi:release factor glutamine methyltransferase
MTVYQPREDSKLLAKAVLERDLSGKRCLDMGTGTGIIALKMIHAGAEEVVAVDKNPEAVDEARSKLQDFDEAEVFKSDLFGKVESQFDLIAFNPPYLPEEEGLEDDGELFGGESGEELTEKFLEQAEKYLAEDGYVLFVVSSNSGFDTEEYDIVDTEKLWFEDLLVLKSG